MHLHVTSMTAKLVSKSLPEYSPGGPYSRSYTNHSIVLSDNLIEWCSSYDEAQLLITSSRAPNEDAAPNLYSNPHCNLS